MSKLFKWTGLFESNLSAAEWAWRVITIAITAVGGTTTAFLAKGTALFESSGPLAWFAIGLLSALLIALVFFLVQLGSKQTAEASYLRSLSMPKSQINPMAESFTDLVIHLPDLYLPGRQVQSHKQFKRCKLVGPGAIAIFDGTYVENSFIESGSVIVLPHGTKLAGALIFENCTVEACEFLGITLLASNAVDKAFQEMGAEVVGMLVTT